MHIGQAKAAMHEKRRRSMKVNVLTEEIKKTVNERQKTHGKFDDNSKTYARLIAAIPPEAWQAMSEQEFTAAHQILLKLARISNSRRFNQDSWVDIAGYASLVLSYHTEEGQNGGERQER